MWEWKPAQHRVVNDAQHNVAHMLKSKVYRDDVATAVLQHGRFPHGGRYCGYRRTVAFGSSFRGTKNYSI